MPSRFARQTPPLPSRDFVVIAQRWCGLLSKRLLTFIWQGFERLCAENPPTLNLRDERNVTQHLVGCIRRYVSRYAPYDIEHHPFEESTQSTPRAQPPAPDLGFLLHADKSVMWPIEAKVLHSDSDVRDYAAELTDNFLTGRYGPFSSQGALLGYLLAGNADTAFANIATSLSCKMGPHPAFMSRPQRLSEHTRNLPPGRNAPQIFICHHLLFTFPLRSAP